MQFNRLIPELSVSDLKKSLDFYIGILGFKIGYERKENKFVFLSFQGSQIMLDESNENEKSPWYTGKLEYPRGRGIHFQFEVDSIEPLLKKLKEKNWPIKAEPKVYEFRKEKEIIKMRGFLVMDPDGYLIMFNEIK